MPSIWPYVTSTAAIPHWMPWQQRLGWVTLRIMSIHHLDTFRYWFGNPVRVFASEHDFGKKTLLRGFNIPARAATGAVPPGRYASTW